MNTFYIYIILWLHKGLHILIRTLKQNADPDPQSWLNF